MRIRIVSVLLAIGGAVMILGGEYYAGSAWLEKNAEYLVLVGIGLILLAGVIWIKPHLEKLLGSSFGGRWLSLEEAARFFRDEAHKLGLVDIVDMIDGFNKENETDNSVASEFCTWLMLGMNEGHVEVWGAPVTGAKRVKLSPNLGMYFEESLESMLDRGAPWNVIEERGGAQYNDLLISKAGLKKFLRAHMEDPAAHPVRRIEPRVDL